MSSSTLFFDVRSRPVYINEMGVLEDEEYIVMLSHHRILQDEIT